MRRAKEYISKNWILIVAGVLLTEDAVKVVYAERGCLAYGGEWLILPLILLFASLIREMMTEIPFFLGEDDDDPE